MTGESDIENNMTEDEATPAKRGRGRPKKTELQKKIKVKSGLPRGRPKKEVGSSSSPSKGRGRPRKNLEVVKYKEELSDEEEDEEDEPVTASPKKVAVVSASKGRGRPRKSPATIPREGRVETPKAGRGRPPKRSSPIKGRGRPRKYIKDAVEKPSTSTGRKRGRPSGPIKMVIKGALCRVCGEKVVKPYHKSKCAQEFMALFNIDVLLEDPQLFPDFFCLKHYSVFYRYRMTVNSKLPFSTSMQIQAQFPNGVVAKDSKNRKKIGLFANVPVGENLLIYGFENTPVAKRHQVIGDFITYLDESTQNSILSSLINRFNVSEDEYVNNSENGVESEVKHEESDEGDEGITVVEETS